ncbi:hypothetical protein AB1A65_06410 [Muricauda sp. ANG21]|uniref:hypothetical protein n=1 Tax=Allomuricauda sp. ANG21 TaxID=3042468 RepID=UPI0034569350
MVTQIEHKLTTINGDDFAVLCRQYLNFKYSFVYPTGLVVGKDKSRKGTPDTFIPVGDYYLFVEITTKTGDILTKLKSDISHCFSQNDVPKEKIIKVVLMFNGVHDTVKHEELKTCLSAYSEDCRLEVVDIRILANEISQNYPSLARKLDIPIDTAQILEVSEFVEDYEKSKFATPLSNEFFNRETEIEEGLNNLKEKDILLISGYAGTGKTKLSIELTKLFLSENKNYDLKYIRANGNLDIWQDLQIFLLPEKDYLLVLDDANKLKDNLIQILNFQRKRVNKGRIKIILTVRNYVKGEVQKFLDDFVLIELKPFARDELGKILQSDEYNISDYYAERIFNISKGNPRLAIMAVIAGQSGELEKLNNPSQILETYFSSVKESIDSFENRSLLAVAGLLSFFKTINLENETQVGEIEKYFSVSKLTLEENLRILYNLEIADEFERIYKVADQILGEYILYLVFLKEQEISFSKLIDAYIDKHGRFSLGHILKEQINNFSLELIGELISNDIKEGWHKIKTKELAISFIDDFYYYIPHESLSYFDKKTKEIKGDNPNDYTFKIFNERHSDTIGDKTIEILIRFQYLGKEQFLLALKIITEYGLKSELRFHKLLKSFTERISMDRYSYQQGYFQQICLFDFLYERIQDDRDFYSKIILFIAPTFLRDNYQSNHSIGNQILIGNYNVVLSEEQRVFREKLWKFIFESYERAELKFHCQKCFQEYSTNLEYHNRSLPVIEFDKALLLEFYELKLNFNDFIDNAILATYVDRLNWIQVCNEHKLLKNLKNRAYKLYQKLTDTKSERKERRLGHDDYEKYKVNQIARYTKDFTRSDYMKIVNDLNVIYKNREFHNERAYMLSQSVSRLLRVVGNRNFDLFLELFKKIVRSDYASEIHMDYFTRLRLNREKIFQFRALLSKNIYIAYLPNLQASISSKYLIEEDFEFFKKYLKNKKITYFWFLEELLKRLSPFIEDSYKTYGELLDILLFRARQGLIFVPNTFFIYICNTQPRLFYDKLSVVKDLYLILDETERHFDYSLEVLKIILEKDPDYVISLMDLHFKDSSYLSKSSLLENDFKKLWELENYEEVFTKILNYSNPYHRISDNPDNITNIFIDKRERHINFLRGYLKKTTDKQGVYTVFNIVVSLFNEHRFEFLDLILDKGIDFNTFQKLDFVVLSSTFSGSRVPRLKYKISEYEKYKEYLQKKNNTGALDFINELERKIYLCKTYIERERKDEFLKDWGI